MSQWPTAPLGTAIELAYGKSLPKGSRVEGGSIPVYGSNGITGWHDAAVVDGPTVIVGRKGSAGAVQFVDGPCFPIDTTYYACQRQGFDFDIKFLYYQLRQLDLSRLKTATGVPGLTREDAYRETIAVPPIHEQQRIVDILARAEGIVRLRRDADKKAAELIPALFLEMFGDPATNQKGWPAAPLGDLCDVKGGGTPSKQNPAFWIGEIPWVSPKDMSGVEVIKDAEDHISVDAVKSSATNLIPVDSVLIVTRSGVLKHTIPCAITSRVVAINQDIKAFVPRKEIAPHFLLSQLQIRAKEILGLVRVGATVQNIETEALKRMRFIYPSLDVQVKFSEKCEQIRSIQSQQSTATTMAQATFDALLSQVFAKTKNMG